MKGFAHDELTKNYYSTLKLLQSFSFESLSSLFQMQAAGFIQKNPMIDVFQTTCWASVHWES